jgi:hypothetical protein
MRADSCSVVRALALGITLGGIPACLAAQGKAAFIPFVGLYAPTAKVIEESCGTGCTASVKQKATVIFGGRVGVEVTDRIAIEGSVAYAPSKVEFAERESARRTRPLMSCSPLAAS